MKHIYNICKVGVLALISSVALAGEGVVVGGYVDAQWGIDDAKEGSRIQGGQVSFSKTVGDSSVVLEIPFSAVTGSDVTTGSSDMTLGKNSGQAFIRTNHSNGIYWMMGQWDGIFGLERNDTNMVQFTNQGALFSTQPKVNSGLLVGYKLSDSMNLEAYVSGRKDEGGADSMNKPELGLKYSMTGDMKFSLGFTGHQEKSATNEEIRRMYANSVFSMNVAGMDLGAEVSYSKAGEGDAGMGLGLIGSYAISEGFTFGARIQKLDKFASFSQTEITVGPQYVLSKELRVKADFTNSSVTATEGAEAVAVKSGALAAVYTF